MFTNNGMGGIKEFIKKYFNDVVTHIASDYNSSMRYIDDNMLIIDGYCIWLDVNFYHDGDVIDVAVFKTQAIDVNGINDSDIILNELETMRGGLNEVAFVIKDSTSNEISDYCKSIIYKDTTKIQTESTDMDLRLLLI